jgi:benzoyl-CoA reductase/2-hydroxyglutaryl-CoA dehydratase subunit BcrC/BadD/HgdB
LSENILLEWSGNEISDKEKLREYVTNINSKKNDYRKLLKQKQ